MKYADAIRNAAMAEIWRLQGRAKWSLAKYKRVTKLLRYSHRADGVWS